ncbi:MAG: flavin reductase [Bacteroidota bacterium]
MEKIWPAEEFVSKERYYRRDFFNTLPGVKNLQLIGTQGENGIANLGLFNSLVHIGANPPMLGFIMRPLTVPRQTYENIKANRYYTFNQVHRGILDAAHQASAKYTKEQSEFEAVGLYPQYTNLVKAPYVAEAKVKIGMEYLEEYEIKANGTILVIGKVIEVILPEEVISETGHIDTAVLDGVGVAGLDAYYGLEYLGKKAYPRP